MTIIDLYKFLEKEKKTKDNINCTYFSKADCSVCKFVINNTFSYSFSPVMKKRISKYKLIKESLIKFRSFDKENYSNLLDIVYNTRFIKDLQDHNGSVALAYDVLESNKKYIVTDTNVVAYHIPKILYETDIITLGHEYCHSLKETNYPEHKNCLVCGEVIPIFYELINYENDDLRFEYLQNRLYWLTRQKYTYELITEDINFWNRYLAEEYDMNKKRNIYAFAKSYYGSYITGFYYALILYSMYKKDPDKILRLISDVLKHNLTTLDMLKKLNIYCDIKGDVYKKEIDGMKKILTNR